MRQAQTLSDRGRGAPRQRKPQRSNAQVPATRGIPHLGARTSSTRRQLSVWRGAAEKGSDLGPERGDEEGEAPCCCRPPGRGQKACTSGVPAWQHATCRRGTANTSNACWELEAPVGRMSPWRRSAHGAKVGKKRSAKEHRRLHRRIPKRPPEHGRSRPKSTRNGVSGHGFGRKLAWGAEAELAAAIPSLLGRESDSLNFQEIPQSLKSQSGNLEDGGISGNDRSLFPRDVLLAGVGGDCSANPPKLLVEVGGRYPKGPNLWFRA